MHAIFSKRHPKAGARPGTLVIKQDAPPPKIRIMHFTADHVEEADVTDPESLRAAHSPDTITWVDIQGFGDEDLIRKIGSIFSLHPLAIEDVVNVPQRPKAEPYDDQMLIIVRMIHCNRPAELEMEQVSIVLGKDYVLTFQERYGDVLDPVRSRIRSGKGPIRRSGSAYVAYAIFDTIVDGYYPKLEEIGNLLEHLEEAVVEHPTPHLIKDLNRIKNRLHKIRRAIWPQREAATKLVREEHSLIDPNVRLFLRDTYDHCVQASEVTEMYREMVTGLMNTYLSSIANRTNEVMKVLTIVATTFIPLTFLAGIYGMNFDHMPELHVWWAYPIIWSTMLLVAAGMLVFFWKKGWIGYGDSNPEAHPQEPGGVESTATRT